MIIVPGQPLVTAYFAKLMRAEEANTSRSQVQSRPISNRPGRPQKFPSVKPEEQSLSPESGMRAVSISLTTSIDGT